MKIAHYNGLCDYISLSFIFTPLYRVLEYLNNIIIVCVLFVFCFFDNF